MSLHSRKHYFRIRHSGIREFQPETVFPDGLELRLIASRDEQQDFYDTFAWQAFRNGFVVLKKRNALFLLDSKTGIARASMMSPARRSFFFSGEFPPGRVKDFLSACSDIRAFIKLCSFSAALRTSHVVDANGTPAGILTTGVYSHTGKNERDAFLQFLSFQSFRGSRKVSESLEKSFSDCSDLLEPVDFSTFITDLMSSAGLNVQGYSSRLELQLKPDATIHESAGELFSFTLSVMRQNEPGIRKNIDTEFLHDYRVALRRTRSVLKQLRGVYDHGEKARQLCALQSIGKRTNALRDCDVLLLNKQFYTASLPSMLEPHLGFFFMDIASKRSELQKEFARYLVSDDYRSLLDDWKRFIGKPLSLEHGTMAGASLSTMEYALKSIGKAWKKVIRHGRNIAGDATDTELHALRIDCKKLRYLLEFFSSLFPRATVRQILGHLKKLQDNLGNFIDASLQLRYLEAYLPSVQEDNANRLQIAAVGGLMATLFQSRERFRSDFHSVFRDFDSNETEQLFLDLLGTTS